MVVRRSASLNSAPLRRRLRLPFDGGMAGWARGRPGVRRADSPLGCCANPPSPVFATRLALSAKEKKPRPPDAVSKPRQGHKTAGMVEARHRFVSAVQSSLWEAHEAGLVGNDALELLKEAENMELDQAG